MCDSERPPELPMPGDPQDTCTDPIQLLWGCQNPNQTGVSSAQDTLGSIHQ